MNDDSLLTQAMTLTALVGAVEQRGQRRDVAKTFKSLALLPFFGPAWLLARLARVLWRVLSWTWDSFMLGIERGWGK